MAASIVLHPQCLVSSISRPLFECSRSFPREISHISQYSMLLYLYSRISYVVSEHTCIFQNTLYTPSTFSLLNPQQQCRSETETFFFKRIFSVQYCHSLKKYHPSGNLKFNILGISQSLKSRILKEKILSISLNLNFTSNTLGFYGLRT